MTSELPLVHWFKSTHSGDKADCVEVAFLPGGLVGVRDSKAADAPSLTFSAEGWDHFVQCVMDGEFGFG
ncbi:DUF397 domain-containing protein [Nocardia sp. CC227C]|uniref:DUF397 domain-containing protein n=1 Tax=Nocardia sp. CC227C TaxID=3044562 RepID=UPI00278C478A|nr:DUF397 domain-containing protein [Nocardia sp. CC227C]